MVRHKFKLFGDILEEEKYVDMEVENFDTYGEGSYTAVEGSQQQQRAPGGKLNPYIFIIFPLL